ncbi:hypothetical protein STCU_12115 [Strigomonas culicis]|uniref:Uncharacterized protein n=1 Tax=Strigomonas culicis TaxID=28005 RepID=S9TBD6_9TRYP|nr:hypothetical protein STCU_12115 [Strigomonas culicis]|eukprot:EPY15327.1 hypothetical protein STCU_12115 [Strigomonas culicis]
MERVLRLPLPLTQESSRSTKHDEDSAGCRLDRMNMPSLLSLQPDEAPFTAVQVLCQALYAADPNRSPLPSLNSPNSSTARRLAWGCATAPSTAALAVLFEAAVGKTPALTSLDVAELLWSVMLHRLVELERYETVVKRGEAEFHVNELRVLTSFLSLIEGCAAEGTSNLASIQKERYCMPFACFSRW